MYPPLSSIVAPNQIADEPPDGCGIAIGLDEIGKHVQLLPEQLNLQGIWL